MCMCVYRCGCEYLCVLVFAYVCVYIWKPEVSFRYMSSSTFSSLPYQFYFCLFCEMSLTLLGEYHKDYTDLPVYWKDLLESASQCWAVGIHPCGRLSHGSWESQLWSLWVWGRHSPECKGSVSPLHPLLPNLQISVTTFEMLFINLFHLSCFCFLINKNITIHEQDCHSCGWNTN